MEQQQVSDTVGLKSESFVCREYSWRRLRRVSRGEWKWYRPWIGKGAFTFHSKLASAE